LLLGGVTGLVFSDAVLEAAVGSSTLSKEAYVSSVLSQPCSLTTGATGYSSLLKPVGVPIYDPDTWALQFDAQLLADFAGGKAGDLVRVYLDLFSELPVIKLVHTTDSLKLPVQLLVGRSFSDADKALCCYWLPFCYFDLDVLILPGTLTRAHDSSAW
jgi:hypothetical protein